MGPLTTDRAAHNEQGLRAGTLGQNIAMQHHPEVQIGMATQASQRSKRWLFFIWNRARQRASNVTRRTWAEGAGKCD
eukprot:11637758-Alexandrium_andersonii.AAC.1